MPDDDVRLDEEMEAPNYTQFPNLLLDWLMPKVSGAEFKVIAYIVRQTWGYHRYDDFVSISLTAIVAGTGLSRSAVNDALKMYDERGFILIDKHASPAHGKESNTYRLRVRKNGIASSPGLLGSAAPSSPETTSPSSVGLPPILMKENRKDRIDKNPDLYRQVGDRWQCIACWGWDGRHGDGCRVGQAEAAVAG